MSAVMERISGAFQNISDLFGAAEYADACAIGVWTDDPSDPGVTAVVFQGKLYALTIPDSYTSFSGEVLSDIVNGVIVNAYIEWGADRKRLMSAATRRVGAA